MIGTTILTMIIFILLYPILTRKKQTRGRAIWLYKQQIRKKYLKNWKPTSKESELIITESGVSMKGVWRTRPKLRYKLKNKKAKIIYKITFSLIIMISIYSVFHIPLPFLFGVVNTWDNSDGDNIYSADANWSQGHKPAGTEDIIIPDTSIIGKCTMDENGAAGLGTFTVQVAGEFEIITFTLDVIGPVTLTGTFTGGTGTLKLTGGGSQNVTSGGNSIHHVIVSGASTIYFMVDNTEIFDLEILTGSTFEIDAVTQAATLTLTFSDIAGAGLVDGTAGTLLCQGDVTFGVTITSAGAPPTNFWNASNTTINTQTLTYTTIEYHNNFFGRTSDSTWTNVTVQNSGGSVSVLAGAAAGNALNWTNVTIDGNGKGISLLLTNMSSGSFDNVSISNSTTTDIQMNNALKYEFTNSNFDVTKVINNNTGSVLISNNHNDGANTWEFWAGSAASQNKSGITNDFISTDNVTIQTGTLTVDEAAAHTNLTIKTGGTFDVNGGITQTIANTGTITVESGGTLEWTGSAGSLITIRSDVPGTQYSLDVQTGGTLNVNFVDVQDCDATGGPKIDVTNESSVGKHQNNGNWSWPRPDIHTFGMGTIASRP